MLLPEAQGLTLARPADWQPGVIGKLVSGEPDRLTTVEDRSDDAGGEEAKPD